MERNRIHKKYTSHKNNRTQRMNLKRRLERNQKSVREYKLLENACVWEREE